MAQANLKMFATSLATYAPSNSILRLVEVCSFG